MPVVRVGVLGLDGLSYGYLERLLREGGFPTLRRVYESSYKFVLDAFPPVTPPSWSSILTGVNPGKHGIFGFLRIGRDRSQELFTAEHLGHPRIHEMMAMVGVPSIMVNPIPDYPIFKIRKAQVISHSFFAPKPLYYPEHMRRYVDILGPVEEAHGTSPEAYVGLAEKYLALIEEMVDGLEWSLLWVNLPFPDPYLHYNPEMLDPRSKITKAENRVFEFVDKIIGRVLENSDSLIVVSDHGFKTYQKVVSVNRILHDMGCVKLTVEEGKRLRDHMEFVGFEEPVQGGEKKLLVLSPEVALRLRGLGGPARALKKAVKMLYRAFTGRELALREPSVDIRASDALLEYTSSGIYVFNEELIPKIIEGLRSFDCIRWVGRREEVYWGPYVGRAPEIIVRPNYEEGCFFSSSRVLGRPVVRLDKPIAQHGPRGVFMVKAPFEKRVEEGSRLPPYAVAPLVMGLLGLPFPESADIAFDELPLRVEGVRDTFNYLGRWRLYRRTLRTWRKLAVHD